MSWIIRDKSFYKSLLLIAIPVALQNIISLSVNLVDTIMIGSLGDVSLAASSIANQVFFMMTVLTFGIAGGSNVMSAQYWGKNDSQMVRCVFSTAHKAVIIITLIFSCGAFFFPQQIMSIFTTDPLVIAEGTRYLKVIFLCYISVGIGNCTLLMFRSVGSVNMSVFVYSISLVTNVFWNWVFIFGNLGAPAMGITGAAIATVIARTQEVIIILAYTFFIDKKICYKPKDFFTLKKEILPDFIANVSPVVFNEFLWSTGAAMLSVIIGRIGTDFVAANSVVSVLNQFVSVAIMGISSAAAVLIGNAIGRGEYERVKVMAKTIMLLGVGVGMTSSAMVLILRPVILNFYGNLSVQTKEYAYLLMGIASVIVFFQSIASVNMMGTLRGGGDSKFVLMADIVFMWCLAIPMGFIGAFYLGWSIPLVYIALKCDEVLKSALCVVRVIKGKWIKDITM